MQTLPADTQWEELPTEDSQLQTTVHDASIVVAVTLDLGLAD